MLLIIFFVAFTLLVFAILNIFFIKEDDSVKKSDKEKAKKLDKNNYKDTDGNNTKNYNFRKKIDKPIVFLLKNKKIDKLFSEKIKKTENNLLRANYPFNLKKEDFIAIEIFIPLFVGLIAGILAVTSDAKLVKVVGIIIGSIIFAYLIINTILKSAINKRKKKSLKELPDFIDLLTINLEAGLGFDLALKRIISKKKGILGEEFNKYLIEVEVGKSRKEALINLANRLDIDPMYMLVKSITQAEELGVSIVKVLRLQSIELREKRKANAEEKAMKAPIKILFPLLFFIFPVIFIVLLLPIAIQLVEAFK